MGFIESYLNPPPKAYTFGGNHEGNGTLVGSLDVFSQLTKIEKIFFIGNIQRRLSMFTRKYH